MVKAVVGDDAHLKPFEDRLFAASPPSQVGLVVGKLSAASDRGLVYALLPTPPTDAGAPACSLRAAAGKAKGKGSSEAASLEFDGEWIAEHARQVSRMLLGGMSVVGIYIWASEASFKATPPAALSQAVRGVSQAAPWYDSGFDERLLIHISYSPRRWVCRICELASGSLRPCDFKHSKLLASLQTFRCTYNFQMRLAVVQAEPFKKVISKAISHLAKEVQSAKALIDGDLFSEDMNISSEGPHKVDLLLPFKEDVPAEECSLERVTGLFLFTGCIGASAFLGPKESISEVISDLKVDIITSLRSRLDIILDEAEDGSTNDLSNNAPAQKATEFIFHELREPSRFTFPRRVLIPWLANIYICDYLQPSETIEDAMERCKEVMSLETDTQAPSVVEPETIVASATLRSFWDVVPGASSPARTESNLKDSLSGQKDGTRNQHSHFNLLAVLFVLLVALLVGFMFTFSTNLKT